jgi:AGCS family alanine or glycine:cation symporter
MVVRVLWVLTIVVGSMTTLGFAWDLADTFNGLMIIPNQIALILLSLQVVKMKKDYFSKELDLEKLEKMRTTKA